LCEGQAPTQFGEFRICMNSAGGGKKEVTWVGLGCDEEDLGWIVGRVLAAVGCEEKTHLLIPHGHE